MNYKTKLRDQIALSVLLVTIQRDGIPKDNREYWGWLSGVAVTPYRVAEQMMRARLGELPKQGEVAE